MLCSSQPRPWSRSAAGLRGQCSRQRPPQSTRRRDVASTTTAQIVQPRSPRIRRRGYMARDVPRAGQRVRMHLRQHATRRARGRGCAHSDRLYRSIRRAPHRCHQHRLTGAYPLPQSLTIRNIPKLIARREAQGKNASQAAFISRGTPVRTDSIASPAPGRSTAISAMQVSRRRLPGRSHSPKSRHRAC